MANKAAHGVLAMRPQKAALLNTHMSHLESQSKFHNAQGRPVKQPHLEKPYAASTKSIRDLTITPLGELTPEIHHRGKGIIVRTIAPPYRGSAGAITLVEDEHGTADRLALYNHGETSILSNPPESCVLAIREPYYKHDGANGCMICVDHPSDVVMLRFDDDIVPKGLRLDMVQSAGEWRVVGDQAFIQRDFPTAVYCYSEALEAMVPNDSHTTRAGILAKRAGTNLMLGRYDAAMKDALASRTDADSDWRCYFTAAKAAYGLCDYQTCKSHLEAALGKNPHAPGLQKEHKRCLARLREEQEGAYDFPAMLAALSPQAVHVDAGSFLRDARIADSPLHGRGLFAARDMRAGELVFCEKATFMPNQYDPDRASAALYATMAAQLYDNPSLAETILPLYAGDYPRTGLEGSIVDGMPVVDVFLLEHIRLRNCFSCPLSTVANTKTSARGGGGDNGGGGSGSGSGMAKGIWAHAAHMNHACVPNTMRSFVGDMLIARCARDVRAGEELTQQYVPVKADAAARQAQFRESWGFECACALCAAEARCGPEGRRRRRDVLARVEKLAAKHRGDAAPAEAAVRAMEKLARRMEELHEEEGGGLYERLPRLGLIYPTIWLLEAHRGRKNHAKVTTSAMKILRNFGFMVGRVEDIDRVFQGSGSENSLMTLHVVIALKYASEAQRALGDELLSDKFEKAAKFGYMIVTGFDNELSALEG